jgi:hypothetical protein
MAARRRTPSQKRDPEPRKGARARASNAAGRRSRVSGEQPEGAPDSTLRVEVIWGDVGSKDIGLDVLLVGHYVGVLPQRAELRLDQLVSQADEDPSRTLVITELARRGAIRGELGEVTFFPGRGPQLVALAGMGRSGMFRAPQLRRLARTVAQVVGLLPRHDTLGTVAIGTGEGNLAVTEAVRVFLRSVVEVLASDPRLTIRRLSFIERNVDRAMEVLAAVQETVDELQRAPEDRRMALEVHGDLVEKSGGVIPAEFGCAMILASLGMPGDDTQQVNVLDTLLARLPENVRGEVRERLLEQQRRPARKFANPLRAQAMRFRLRETGPAPAADQRLSRISFQQTGEDILATAITNAATVTERQRPRRARHVLHLAERLCFPSTPEYQEQAQRLRNLAVHRDIQEVLDQDDPLVIELDRAMASVQWEMLPAGSDRRPLGVFRPVARQLRTYFSPRPFDLATVNGRRAMVIGDPTATLDGAFEEASAVHKILRKNGIDSDLLFGPPEPGTGAGPREGVPAADYFEVVERLQSGVYDLVHFCGHAAPEGWLFGDGMLLGAHDLDGMERPPRLVFANACLSVVVSQGLDGKTGKSGKEAAEKDHPGPEENNRRSLELLVSLADQFFRQGVRDYIGTGWEVPSGPAREFATRFYRALFETGGTGQQRSTATFGEALREARAALHGDPGDPVTAWAAYQHYGDPTHRLTD